MGEGVAAAGSDVAAVRGGGARNDAGEVHRAGGGCESAGAIQESSIGERRYYWIDGAIRGDDVADGGGGALHVIAGIGRGAAGGDSGAPGGDEFVYWGIAAGKESEGGRSIARGDWGVG